MNICNVERIANALPAFELIVFIGERRGGIKGRKKRKGEARKGIRRVGSGPANRLKRGSINTPNLRRFPVRSGSSRSIQQLWELPHGSITITFV